MPVNTVLQDAQKKMNDTVEHTRKDLSAIRTGRASLGVLDGVTVEYFGTETPLNQLASLSIPDPTLIVAQPWDVSLIPKIEKSIRGAELGLNPTNDGKVVRIPIPPLTEDRRKQFARRVHDIAEQGRTAVRLERRTANEAFKKLLKDKTISEDEEKRGLEAVQKATDLHIKQIDDLARHKEDEILKI
ncbi:MAG TPA: ribosome recycling factor [Candidatus Polarisedimenticolia bacterium]